jgi:hypothetical protein
MDHRKIQIYLLSIEILYYSFVSFEKVNRWRVLGLFKKRKKMMIYNIFCHQEFFRSIRNSLY